MMGKTTRKNTGKKLVAAIATAIISVASLSMTSVCAEVDISAITAAKTENNVTTEEYVDNVKLGHFSDSKGNVWEFQKHFSVPVGDPDLETALRHDTLEEYYMGCGVTVRKCTCENGPKFVLPYEGLDYFNREEYYGDNYIEVVKIDSVLASIRKVLIGACLSKTVQGDPEKLMSLVSQYDYYPDYKIDVRDIIFFNKGYSNAPWCYIQRHDPILTTVTLNMPKDKFMSVLDSHEGEDEFFIGLNDFEDVKLSAANMVQLAQEGVLPEKVFFHN